MTHNLQVPQNNHWLFEFKGSLLFWHFAKWEHWLYEKENKPLWLKHTIQGCSHAPLKSPVRLDGHMYNYRHAILVRSGLSDPNLSKFISGIFNTTAAVKRPEIWHLYMDKYSSFTGALIPLSQWNKAGTQPVNLWISLSRPVACTTVRH